jgi:hypothetical protein
MTQHWEYLSWGPYVAAALGAWRYLPLAIFRLAAAFTHDETRHRQCMEVIRMARLDAAHIPSYLPTPSTDDKLRRRSANLSDVRRQFGTKRRRADHQS